ncbi:MAG: hypothetical protein KF746_10830 [Chitinophagaceae bacterium]|nr:hypothetical protein [Chitinophagaceae bacterium]
MKPIPVIILFLALAVSCSKDKFESKPTLKLKEMIGNYAPRVGNPMIQYVLEYTDAEGDIAGVPIWVQKNSSKSPCDPDPTIEVSYTDSSSFTISEEVPPTVNQKGEITIIIKEQYFARIKCNPSDTVEQAVFKFWFKDQAGNMSDTVTAPPITIEKAL